MPWMRCSTERLEEEVAKLLQTEAARDGQPYLAEVTRGGTGPGLRDDRGRDPDRYSLVLPAALDRARDDPRSLRG